MYYLKKPPYPEESQAPRHPLIKEARGVLLLIGLFAMGLLVRPHTTNAQAPTLTEKGPFTPCEKTSPEMLCIPGGIYIQGSEEHRHHPKADLRGESPRHKVVLQTFYIDKKEITTEEYTACVNAGHCQPPLAWFSRKGSLWARFRPPLRPFVSATWDMAQEYCAYRGKRLLTEAEWEAAARGKDGDTYPWGNAPPRCEWANYRVEPPHTSYPNRNKMRFCPPPQSKDRALLRFNQDQTWDVGSTPAFRGLYDMAGNGYEWVQDFYDPHAYACPESPNQPCTRINPKGPCDGKGSTCIIRTKTTWAWKRTVETTEKDGKPQRTERWKRILVQHKQPQRLVYRKRVLKGGSWWWYAEHLRAPHRRGDGPYTGTHRLSIRCGSSIPLPQTRPPTGKKRPHIRPQALQKKK